MDSTEKLARIAQLRTKLAATAALADMSVTPILQPDTTLPSKPTMRVPSAPSRQKFCKANRKKQWNRKQQRIARRQCR